MHEINWETTDVNENLPKREYNFNLAISENERIKTEKTI